MRIHPADPAAGEAMALHEGQHRGIGRGRGLRQSGQRGENGGALAQLPRRHFTDDMRAGQDPPRREGCRDA